MLSHETAQNVRLIDQYARISADSERYQRVERIRFLRDLLTRVREHGELITVGRCSGGYTDWQFEFLRRRACRQGVEIGNTVAFILDHLRSSVGHTELATDLQATGCELGRALGRRLATAGMSGSGGELSAVRLCDTTAATSIEHELMPISIGSTESARFDVSAPAGAGADWFKSLRLAIAVDNPSSRSIHGVGVEVRLLAQTSLSCWLLWTGICAFGVVPSIQAGRRSWLALRGLAPDLVGEAAEAGGEVVALRFLIQRV